MSQNKHISEDEACADNGEEPASSPPPALYAEIARHRRGEAKQSTSLGRFERPALIVAGLILSPVIVVSVGITHCRTKRALRRAKTEGDDA